MAAFTEKLASIIGRTKVVSVSSSAFIDILCIKKIYLPPTITHIGTGFGLDFNAFPALIIAGEKGSYAQHFANTHNIEFEEQRPLM